MKEIRTVPLKKKLLSFTVCFFILHVYLAYSAYSIKPEFLYPESSSEPLIIDGSDFTFLLTIMDGIVAGVEVIIFFINVFAITLVNAIVFTVYMLLFNKLFYATVADDGARFRKYSNYIMLALMLTGFLVPIGLNYKIFPASIVSTLFSYLIFSFLAYFITMNKLMKINL